MSKPHYTIEISPRSILFTIGFLILLYFLYQIREILTFVFISLLLMAALNPLVSRLEARRLPRGVSIGLIYLLLIGVIVTSLVLIIPPFVSQVITLISQIPIPTDLAKNIQSLNFSLQDLQIIVNQLTSVPKIIGIIGSAFSGIVIFVSFIVMSFYLLLERVHLPKVLHLLFPDGHQVQRVQQILNQIEANIGGWVRAEITLMICVGVMTFVSLTVCRINYALSLAIIAGLLEIVPNIGPTLSALPAIAVAYFTVSPLMAVIVTIVYILVQQIENNLIVPLVMRQVVGISPAITLILLLIGFTLGGVTGAALAIPVFLVGKVSFLEWYQSKYEHKGGNE